MTFKGVENQSVEMKIVNYRYPNADNEFDSNWLSISVKIDSKFGKKEWIDPSLTTGEFQAIKNWFEAILNDDESRDAHLSFLEPFLTFIEMEAPSSSQKRIRINFSNQWVVKTSDEDKDFVDILCDQEVLKEIVNELKEEVGRFPSR